ncbi:GntR family transcriptional regulator [Micromonospora sp. NPDC049051]|uniref:GntR family transcriptional regulator n=1 Tax=unclassified Micromonospora TaxID=2617518 RepID=UPI0037149B90
MSPQNLRIARLSLAQQAAEYIKSAIYRGELRPGERIPQAAVADALGVSRLPIREALISLEAEGLVELVPHRGAFVIPIRREDIEDHYRAFGLLQGWAAKRASTRIAPEALERLGSLNKALTDATDNDEQHDLNWQFHALINQTGGSRRLLSIMRQLSMNLPREIYQVAPAASPEALADHAELLAALSTGDGDRAEATARRHLEHEAEHIVAKLRRDGVLTDD